MMNIQKQKTMRSFLIGLGVGLLVCPLAVFFYVKSGMMPVTTEDPAMPFESLIAHSAIRAAVEKEKSLTPKVAIASLQLKSSAHLYVNHCAGCHGLINSPESKMAEAMYPRAPQLFQGDDRITDDPVGKIHWKIKNGIRLTGMPAFKNILTDDEMWQLSALLQQADQLTDETKAELLLTPTH